MSTKVENIDQLQAALKGWFKKPGETDEEYRNRINNDPSLEISIPLFGVSRMIEEQEERLRFDAAKPVESNETTFFETVDNLDAILAEANQWIDYSNLFKAIKWEAHFQAHSGRILGERFDAKYIGTPKARAYYLWGMNPQLYGELADRLPVEFNPSCL